MTEDEARAAALALMPQGAAPLALAELEHYLAAAAGLDPTTSSVRFDLDAMTEDERDLLADHGRSPVIVTVPTQEAVLQTLRTAASEEREQLEEILTAYRDVLHERRTHSWRSQTREDGVTFEVIEPDWPNKPGAGRRDRVSLLAKYREQIEEITVGEEARAWTEDLDVCNRQARDDAWTRQHQLDREEERQRVEAVGRLRDWALVDGSERVRLLIEEDMDAWYAIAEDEYFTEHTPPRLRAARRRAGPESARTDSSGHPRPPRRPPPCRRGRCARRTSTGLDRRHHRTGPAVRVLGRNDLHHRTARRTPNRVARSVRRHG